MEPPLAQAATLNMEGPSPLIAVVLGGQDFFDPATVTTNTYNYALTDNRLASIAEASGHTRTFTYDAAGNTIYDNRSGGGYGYTYDALGRMATFSINGVVQAEYEYNAQGSQVVRRLTQAQQTIHNVFDLDGNRIAEYLYDEVGGTSTLIREYIWLNGHVIGVWEGGQLFYVRSDHIGRPVFATNDLGFKVWEASYLPFGGVEASSGPNIGLRLPGQWFQSESGLHQNWMRDYDPTTGSYLQGDPLGLVDGASVYGYALQNPGRYYDPTGEAIPVAIVAGVALGAGIDLLIQAWMNDWQLSCVNWGQVGLSGALGSFGGGFFQALHGGAVIGGSTLKWYTMSSTIKASQGYPSGYIAHHAIIRAKPGHPPSVLNNWWNIKPLKPTTHNHLHGQCQFNGNPMNPVSHWWHGTPNWLLGAELSALGGSAVEALD